VALREPEDLLALRRENRAKVAGHLHSESTVTPDMAAELQLEEGDDDFLCSRRVSSQIVSASQPPRAPMRARMA
jgi:hypothetical protein